MGYRCHIFGASGAGTTTLGRALSARLGGKHLDTDSYYWEATDPPFTIKREPKDRVAMILRDVEDVENWVLSGSICSWGDPLLSSFNLAVFLRLAPATRLRRLRAREALRHGKRILPGGDMHQQHLEFMAWAESYDSGKAPIRSLDLHTSWMQRLDCPVLELDSANSTEELCDQILVQANAARG
ncbi:MAG: AAA family ATPase [Pseudomonadota bacterium]